MATYRNKKDIQINAKKKLTQALLELTFGTELKHFDAKDIEFRDPVLEQVEVCEGLLCPISVEKIIEWVESKDIGKVRTEARTIKFSA